MKIWIDDIRQAPEGYIHVFSTNQAIELIITANNFKCPIEVIDVDHDAGPFAKDGGDYIKVLDFLEEAGLSYPIHIHSMNLVGVARMRQIIKVNNWKEI